MEVLRSGTGDSLPTGGDGAQNAANVLAQLAAMVNKSQQAIGEVMTVVKYDGRGLTYQESKNHTRASMYRRMMNERLGVRRRCSVRR